jgi:hypothetical protein
MHARSIARRRHAACEPSAHEVRTHPVASWMASVLLALGAAWALSARSFAQCTNVDPVLGNWQGPWDYSCLIPDPAVDHPQGAEFSHAALIPHGYYRGKVLLWRSQREPDTLGYTTATYIFDPVQPNRLFQINQTLASDIFCAGKSWDSRGSLVVTGGLHSGPGSGPPDETYRFLPTALGPVFELVNPPTCGPNNVHLVQIGAAPWALVAHMSIGRYYPTLLTLTAGSILSAVGAPIPGASSFVIGGHGAGLDPQPPHSPIVEGGNEFWQLLPPNATTWSQTLYSDDAANHNLLIPPSNEQYLRKSTTTVLPDVLFNSYPRGLQLTDIVDDSEPEPHHRNVFVANDVWPDLGNPTTAAGSAWAIRPRYTSLLPSWELWRAPSASFNASFPNDRHYGDAVLLHTQEPNQPTSDGRNRVLVMGGEERVGSTIRLTEVVQEFKPGINPADESKGAAWVTKTNGITPRVHINSVILPDRTVLVLGGFEQQAGQPLGTYVPFDGTELLDPGAAGGPSNASTQTLADRPLSPSGQHPYPRVYHSVGLLLVDGRVLLAGGAKYDQTGYDGGQFSAEMFCPPYMGYPHKPQVVGISSYELAFDQPFTVDVLEQTGEPIVRFVLLRPAARTHHFDSDQRYVELAIEGVSLTGNIETYQVRAPTEDLGPPGYWMLFAVRDIDQGAALKLNPSVGMFIKLY